MPLIMPTTNLRWATAQPVKHFHALLRKQWIDSARLTAASQRSLRASFHYRHTDALVLPVLIYILAFSVRWITTVLLRSKAELCALPSARFQRFGLCIRPYGGANLTLPCDSASSPISSRKPTFWYRFSFKETSRYHSIFETASLI